MHDLNYYKKLVKNAEILILQIQNLEKKGIKKNKKEIALLNTSLSLTLVNIENFLKAYKTF
ncbi:hypothetical protein CPAV1605_1033 [seawater metagenome]|uniref:Uncharacterized protein n=1 Tax=seawater metagenome TaxID=1561972 RepID=A0A5E8CLT3_9ZZZZ